MLEKVRERMAEEGIECLVLTDEYDILYVTGLQVHGHVFVTQEEVDVLVSKFYRYEDWGGFDPDFYSSREELENLLKERKEKYGSRVSVESGSEKLMEKFDAEEPSVLKDARLVKTAEEVEKIEKAVEVTEGAFRKLEERLFTGITEREAVSIVQQYFAEHGVEDAFIQNKGTALVHRNCLRPHRKPRDSVIEEEDIVIVDIGARYENYCADMTRTFSVNPSDEKESLWQDVREIQKSILEVVEPGVPVSDIRSMEMELVEEKGYSVEENLLHSTGHGVGLEVHEKPSITRESDATLEEGMVLAVEPALYVPGTGGCRIEDNVLVTGSGCERISSLDRGPS